MPLTVLGRAARALVVAAVALTSLLPAAPVAAMLVDGGSVAAGATGTGTDFSFAEGTTRPGFQEYLTLQNPSAHDTAGTIVYNVIDATSGQRARRADPLTLPPGRTTVDVNATIGADRDVSISVSTADPIVAERPT